MLDVSLGWREQIPSRGNAALTPEDKPLERLAGFVGSFPVADLQPELGPAFVWQKLSVNHVEFLAWRMSWHTSLGG